MSFDVVTLLPNLISFFGVGAIVSAVLISWWKGKKEYDRIKSCLKLELDFNLDISKEIVSSMEVHSFTVPLLKEEAWHILMSSDQLKKFGGQRVEDPILELGYIYRKISLVNQTILSRQSITSGAVRTSPSYYGIVNRVDSVIKIHTEEIIRLIERDRSCFQQKDWVKAFRDMALGKNEVVNRIIEQQATQDAKT